MGTYAKQKKEEKKLKKLAKQAELTQNMQKQTKKKQVLNSILIGVGLVAVGLLIRGVRTSSQSTQTKDERRIAMETAACSASLAGTTRYAGYGCYEYCNGKQREKKSGCSDSPDNSQYRSNQPCVGLPAANAQRNGATAIDQIWDGNKRYPTTTGRYNEGVSNGECTFSCQSGYDWDTNSSSCEQVGPQWICDMSATCDAADITIGDYTMQACNLGSFTAGTGIDSYGCYFQRGNNYGFANTGTVTPNSTGLVSNATRPYSSSTWIYGMSSPYDRASPQNDGLRGGSTTDGPDTIPTNKTERQGPCPSGYHVPSQGERNQLLIAWASANNVSLSDSSSGYKYFSNFSSSAAIKFSDDFLLPLAGCRDCDSPATVYDQGIDGYYWSSSPNSTYARSLGLYRSYVGTYNGNYRARGHSLRCFKNS